MKLNLNCGTDIRNGYLNIGTALRKDLPLSLYKTGDIIELDWVCDDNSVDEIVAMNATEIVPFDSIKDMLKNWVEKMSPYGVLKMSSIDLYIVSKLFVETKISTKDFLGHIWGQNGKSKLSSIDANCLRALLLDVNLTIVTERYDGISFYVEAVKA